MNKTYTRINWQNAPSEATALNDVNLNKMDSAIDTIDDRVVAHDTQLTNDESAISTLQGSVVSNISDIAALQGSVASQASDITALQSGKVDKIAGKGLCDIKEFDTTWITSNVGTYIGTIKYKTQGSNNWTSRSIYNQVVVDSALDSSSINPVQNKVVTNALAGKVDKESNKGLFNLSTMSFLDNTSYTGDEVAYITFRSHSQDPSEPDLNFAIYNGMVAITNAEIDALA